MNLEFGLMLGGYGVGAVGALLMPGGRAGRGIAAFGMVWGGAAGLALSLQVLLGGAAFTLEVPTLLSIADGLAFRLDALGAFFLGLVGLLAIPCGVYGFGYFGRVRGALLPAPARRDAERAAAVAERPVMADNALTFLMAWEAMSLSAYAMVLIEATTVRERSAAAHWYIALTHPGFVALLAMFLLLSGGGDLSTSFAGDAIGVALTPGTRGTRRSRWPSSASAPRRASLRCTYGCPWRIRSPRATSRP